MSNLAFQAHIDFELVKKCEDLDDKVKVAIIDGSAKLYASTGGELYVLLPGGKKGDFCGPYGAS